MAKDTAYLENGGVDVLFCPVAAEVYPPGYRTYAEVSGLQDKLCGRSRPGHFRGVVTVVLKLFEIVRPDLAFFGAKDAQQVLIIRRMARDLDLDVEGPRRKLSSVLYTMATTWVPSYMALCAARCRW